MQDYAQNQTCYILSARNRWRCPQCTKFLHSGWRFLLQVTAELAEMDSAHPPVGIGMSRHRLCKGTGGG